MRGHQGWENLKRLVEPYAFEHAPPASLVADDPLRARHIRVPRVFEEPTGSGPPRIVWDASEVIESPDTRDCLQSFIALFAKANRDIVRFARRWGPLGICEHGKPYTHSLECTPLTFRDRVWETTNESLAWGLADPGFNTDDRYGEYRRFWEPLTAWRFYSQNFGTLLAIARMLNDGGKVPARLWFASNILWVEACEYEPLVRGEPYPPYDKLTEVTVEQWAPWLDRLSREDERELFAAHVQMLVGYARVVPLFVWPVGDARPRFTLSFGQASPSSLEPEELRLKIDSLFAVLVAQLVAAVQNPKGIWQCSICNELFVRTERMPRPGQRILCPNPACKRKAQVEDKRKSAAKRRREERMGHQRSTPISTPISANTSE